MADDSARSLFNSLGLQEGNADSKRRFLATFFFHYADVIMFMQMGAGARTFFYFFFALVWFPFVEFRMMSGKDKINACSIYWILLAVTFFLPYITILPFLSSIPGLLVATSTIAGTIFIWFPPLPLYILFTEDLGSIGRITIVSLVIFWLVAAFAGIGPLENSQFFRNSFISRMPNIGIVKGFSELPKKFIEGLSAITDSIQKIEPNKWWGKQVRLAAGDYYTGTVDENENEPVGVYIENIQSSERTYNENDEIKIWTTVSAKTIDEEPITIETACKSAKSVGTITPEKFTIDTFEKEDLLCKVPAKKLEEGTNQIDVYAKFNFKTLAYLKTYFIDKERQRALLRDGINPLDEYKITEKSPLAVYTNGPISIGMQTTTPLIGLSQEEENRDFRLGMTLTNRWRGSIVNITSFHIQMPETMSIVPGSCDKSVIKGESDINLLSREFEDNYVTYHIEPQALSTIESFDDFETINCRVLVDDPISTLGQAPITTKYFRIIVGYKYQLEDFISVNIETEEIEE